MPNPNPNRAWQKEQKELTKQALLTTVNSIPKKYLTVEKVAKTVKIQRTNGKIKKGISVQAIYDHYPEVIQAIDNKKKGPNDYNKVGPHTSPQQWKAKEEAYIATIEEKDEKIKKLMTEIEDHKKRISIQNGELALYRRDGVELTPEKDRVKEEELNKKKSGLN